MAAIRRGVEDDILGPAFDAAFEHRLERFVRSVFGVEREIVAEHDEALPGIAQKSHQLRQRLDILAVDFNELERGGRMCRTDRRMGRLDQRGFSHAARAPQQRIVGRQAVREALGILDQEIAHPVDAFEQRHVDTVDAANRCEVAAFRVPDEGLGGGKVERGRRGWGQPFQRGGDTGEHVRAAIVRHALARRGAGGLFGRAFLRGRRRFGHDCTGLRPFP